MKEESAKDADFAKVWASQQAFMKEYDVWQKWGYLPRNFQYLILEKLIIIIKAAGLPAAFVFKEKNYV